MVRQAHEHDRVDERGRSDEVAETSSGEVERLAHRPGHHETGGEFLDEFHGGGPVVELGVGLVDDDDARGCGRDPPDVVE